MLLDIWRLAVLAGTLVGSSQAQTWRNQVNISMCNWGKFRANTIRDTVYLDGGSLSFQLGYDTGEVQWDNRNNNEGLVYYLNLSSSFNTETSNLTALFGSIEKAGGIAGNLAPNYNDGVMLANDDKFYLYGGLLIPTDSQDYPPADTVLAYERYQYGPYLTDWRPQFISSNLGNDITRYVTNGAGVSAPSENLGFYVSGMRSPDWGPIFDNETASNLSQYMITVDMSEMRHPEFSNESIPAYVPARANAEAVWVPVSASGIVVLIGGVTYPESLSPDGLRDDQEQESERISPEFIQTVSVYDIDSKSWYNQNTTGDAPPQLTEFCSVYASASDGSSHNIYIYGGYDGLSPQHRPSDDVYVLSLPSFKWIHLYSGDSRTYGRKQHKCVKPYPDKMLVLGGVAVGSRACVDMVRVFNLNTGRFQEGYNPTDWSEYQVPDLVTGSIGGDGRGGATQTSPEESWTNSSLADVFAASYTKTIATWYPYNTTTDRNTTATTTTIPSSGGGGFPGWAGAVIGVVLGVLALAGLIAFWFLRGRRQRGSRRQSEVSGRGARVMNWVNAGGAFAPPGPKDPENSTTVSGGLTNETSTLASPTEPIVVSQITAEAGGDPVYEMQGHSTSTYAVELPTPYNNDQNTEQNTDPEPSPSASVPTGYTSPVSPDVPQERDADTPSRPGHQRNASSLSTAPSFSPGYADEVNIAQRPHYVSGVSEASVSSAGTRFGDTGLSNRGLGLEDIPDTEGDR
ncbi:hypothetical protein BJX76DRAFT_340214 [Aspergillus varians]